MPIKKAPPPKKFNSSNTNLKTGKAQSPPTNKPKPEVKSPTTASKSSSSFHEPYAAVEHKQPPSLRNTVVNKLLAADDA